MVKESNCDLHGLALFYGITYLRRKLKLSEMIERFLKAKHWQIFLPAVGVPFILQMILFGSITSKAMALQNSADPLADVFSSGIITSYALIFVVGIIGLIIYYLWMYSVGVGLKKYLPENVHSRTKFFVFCLLFPLAYFGIFIAIQLRTMFTVFSTNFESAPSPESMPMDIFGYMALIIPLHFFAMFCGIYVLRFVAKITRSVELKRRARFSDYIGYFFLVWLYPIGIWILQPKINEIVSGSKTQTMGDQDILDA